MLTRGRQRGNSSTPSCGWASELGISVMLPVHAITEFHPFLSLPLSVLCTGFNVHVVCHAVRRSCHVLQFQAQSLLAHHAAPSSPPADGALPPGIADTATLRFSTIAPRSTADSIVALPLATRRHCLSSGQMALCGMPKQKSSMSPLHANLWCAALQYLHHASTLLCQPTHSRAATRQRMAAFTHLGSAVFYPVLQML